MIRRLVALYVSLCAFAAVLGFGIGIVTAITTADPENNIGASLILVAAFVLAALTGRAVYRTIDTTGR